MWSQSSKIPFGLALLSCHSAALAQGVDILSLVNPLIGTSGGGHVFPGATLPFGMAKASADVDVENQGGFSTGDVTGKITGFSHMHDSGTGGVSLFYSPSSLTYDDKKLGDQVNHA
jgi:putative alpha-1,2-mannosidase